MDSSGARKIHQKINKKVGHARIAVRFFSSLGSGGKKLKCLSCQPVIKALW